MNPIIIAIIPIIGDSFKYVGVVTNITIPINIKIIDLELFLLFIFIDLFIDIFCYLLFANIIY